MDVFIKNNIKLLDGNIQQQSRIVINNVLKFLTEIKEDPQMLKEVDFNKTLEITSKICGVSLRTVSRIKKECMLGEPKCPRSQVQQPSRVTGLNDINESIIRQIVSSFLCTYGKCPSVQVVLDTAKERINGFKCSRGSMRIILNNLGYKYRIRKGFLNKESRNKSRHTKLVSGNRTTPEGKTTSRKNIQFVSTSGDSVGGGVSEH